MTSRPEEHAAPAPAAPAPARVPAPPTAPLGQYSCEGCGARLHYSPGTRSLRCPYCGRVQDVPALEVSVEESSYEQWLARAGHEVLEPGVQVLVCTSCNAHTESDRLATRCPFCGSPLVADVNADPERVVRPAGVVPFIVGKRQADDAFRAWVRSRRFAPGALRKVSTTEAMQGTYLPFWTFDAETETDYSGMRGEHYWTTETVMVNVNGRMERQTQQVRKTRWWPASGHVGRSFDDVVVPATTHLESARLARLEPFHVSTAVPYQAQYLAGHQALRHDVDPPAGLDTAKRVMAQQIEYDCREDIGGDEQQVTSMRTGYADVMFKLVLVPLWLAAYVYAGRTYQVAVNAHSGHVVGDRPWSAWKIALAVIAAIVLAVVAVGLIALASGDLG